MSERKYSVSEIDRMRNAVRDRLTQWTWSKHATGWYRYSSLNQPPREDVEIMLRTYMLNGTDPEELEEELQRHMDRIRPEGATV